MDISEDLFCGQETAHEQTAMVGVVVGRRPNRASSSWYASGSSRYRSSSNLFSCCRPATQSLSSQPTDQRQAICRMRIRINWLCVYRFARSLRLHLLFVTGPLIILLFSIVCSIVLPYAELLKYAMGLHFILLLCIPRLKGFLVNDVHGNSLLTTGPVFQNHILYTKASITNRPILRIPYTSLWGGRT